MNDLRELVKIVTTRGQKNFPLLELKTKNPNKEVDLFHLIRTGQCESDHQAAALMYKTLPNDPRIKMLKSRLRKKLLNHLFFLDFTDQSLKISHRYEQKSLALLFQARTLMNEGESTISASLLRTALALAEEAEFTQIIIDCYQLLLENYSLSSSSTNFYKTKSTLAKYRALAALEQEAADLYYTSRLELNKSVVAKNKYLEKLKNVVQKLEALWTKTNSANIFDFYYKLSISLHELTGNFDEILKTTANIEKLLQKGKINKKRFDERYNKFINVYAYLRVKEYEKGLVAAASYVQVFNRSTNNWFAFMENYFLLAMHAGKYDQAAKLYGEVMRNTSYKKISRTAQERWSLYGTYLYFVNPSDEFIKQSNYRKLMGSVPEHSKDKQGFNVAILILQFMYFVRSQDTDALNYRIDSLKKYADRHLKHQLSKRNLLFFKLLVLLVKENLDYDQAKKKGEPLLHRLKNTPVPGDAYAEIEIMPYEHLWTLILKMLKDQ
ncbi:hypothetical protein HUW51_07000 [Adhaeribacter swui]|uniref:Uncharacterized protein n=1 Tax=Adhaeribacter swui TaxID=2086471 RepID=A0A7G7G5Q4_9BACT|nr:hypothetical protein [Adhaeribacter swui]QNF32488.1 hypothetical protein HUW51_07000 [Adhaeribacter swui]